MQSTTGNTYHSVNGSDKDRGQTVPGAYQREFEIEPRVDDDAGHHWKEGDISDDNVNDKDK